MRSQKLFRYKILKRLKLIYKLQQNVNILLLKSWKVRKLQCNFIHSVTKHVDVEFFILLIPFYLTIQSKIIVMIRLYTILQDY